MPADNHFPALFSVAGPAAPLLAPPFPPVTAPPVLPRQMPADKPDPALFSATAFVTQLLLQIKSEALVLLCVATERVKVREEKPGTTALWIVM